MDAFYFLFLFFFIFWNLTAVLVNVEGLPNPQTVPTPAASSVAVIAPICFNNIRVVIRQPLQKNTTKRNEMSDQQPNKFIDEPPVIYYQAV